jgi:hypothetical protein
VCRLSRRSWPRLRAPLDLRPADWGWDEDQRWTLERVSAAIGRLFHVRYTPRGTSYLLHRIGFPPQVPAHRAAQRDEAAIAAWQECDLGEASRLAAAKRTSASRTRPGSRCARRRPAPGPAAAVPRWSWYPEKAPSGLSCRAGPLSARCPQPLLLPDPHPHRQQGRARSLSEAGNANLKNRPKRIQHRAAVVPVISAMTLPTLADSRLADFLDNLDHRSACDR